MRSNDNVSHRLTCFWNQSVGVTRNQSSLEIFGCEDSVKYVVEDDGILLHTVTLSIVKI